MVTRLSLGYRNVASVLGLSLAIAGLLFLTSCQKEQAATTQGQVSNKGDSAGVKCVCHSKDPAILSMHQVLGMRNCGDCHSEDENLMAKGREKTAEQKAQVQSRKRSDAVCLECHKEGGPLVRTEKSKIGGRWFCPQDQKQFSQAEAKKKGDSFFCPECGQELLDIDRIITESEKKPRNELCIACHPIDSVLRGKHVKVLAASGKSLNECLVCHQSHAKCGGCHF